MANRQEGRCKQTTRWTSLSPNGDTFIASNALFNNDDHAIVRTIQAGRERECERSVRQTERLKCKQIGLYLHNLKIANVIYLQVSVRLFSEWPRTAAAPWWFSQSFASSQSSERQELQSNSPGGCWSHCTVDSLFSSGKCGKYFQLVICSVIIGQQQQQMIYLWGEV